MYKDEFTYNISQDDNLQQEEEYEKQLEKEIESSCVFNAYVDKLEIKNEYSDEELISSKTKEEIVEYKNEIIKKLKAYIASLEQEKQDLIDNFKETTSILLEQIKDNEFKKKGVRPETPMIAKRLKEKGGVSKEDFKSLQSKDKEMIDKYSAINNPKNHKMQRCPNCKKEFSEEEFFAHSLQCLRKAINCKKCGEIISVDKKKEHLEYYRDIKLINKAITENDYKFLNLSLAHGFDSKKKLDNNGNTLLHLISVKGNQSSVKEILNNPDGIFDINILNNNKDTPLNISIINKNEEVALLFITKGASVSLRNKSDMTPLMLSCKYGSIEVAKALLYNGANVDEKNILGETALKIAQINNHEKLAMVLLTEFNANLRLKK